jgi:rRNA processing protein Krr1/Pno1
MNTKDKRVELRTSKFTQSAEVLQMGADFVSAFAMGFDIDDAIALLRLDSLYIQSFDIKDVRQTLGKWGERSSLVVGIKRSDVLTPNRAGCVRTCHRQNCWKGRRK